MAKMKEKFSKKVLGKRIRTEMICGKIVLKAYENGITINPIGSQGVWCPKQKEIFLTKDNAEWLLKFLQLCDSAEKILDGLEEKEHPKHRCADCQGSCVCGTWPDCWIPKKVNDRLTDEFGRSARYS